MPFLFYSLLPGLGIISKQYFPPEPRSKQKLSWTISPVCQPGHSWHICSQYFFRLWGAPWFLSHLKCLTFWMILRNEFDSCQGPKLGYRKDLEDSYQHTPLHSYTNISSKEGVARFCKASWVLLMTTCQSCVDILQIPSAPACVTGKAQIPWLRRKL